MERMWMFLVLALGQVHATSCSTLPSNVLIMDSCIALYYEEDVQSCFFCNQLCDGVRFKSTCLLGYGQVLSLVANKRPCTTRYCLESFGSVYNSTCQAVLNNPNAACPPPLPIAGTIGVSIASALILILLLTWCIQRKYCGRNSSHKNTNIVVIPPTAPLEPLTLRKKNEASSDRVARNAGARPSQIMRTRDLMGDLKRKTMNRLPPLPSFGPTPPPLPTMPPVGSFRFFPPPNTTNEEEEERPKRPMTMMFSKKSTAPTKRSQKTPNGNGESTTLPETVDSLVAQMRAGKKLKALQKEKDSASSKNKTFLKTKRNSQVE